VIKTGKSENAKRWFFVIADPLFQETALRGKSYGMNARFIVLGEKKPLTMSMPL